MSHVAVRWMLMAFLAACLPVFAATAPQSFALSGHGSLLLNLPSGWIAKTNQPSAGKPLIISMRLARPMHR
jgi:hypothetical protein